MIKNVRGVSVIEILVALTVVTLGLLGMTATSAMTTRMVGQGHRYSEAAAIANERFELLRGGGCDAMADGSVAQGHFLVTWEADSVGTRTPGRRIMVIVDFPTTRGVRADTFSTIVSCPR